MERYRYHFRTGSGSNLVELTIGGESAELEVRTRWVGVGTRLYRLRCGHRELSPSYGILTVERAEAIDEFAEFYDPSEEVD